MKHEFLNPLAFAVLTGTTAKYPGKISQIKSLNDLGTWKKLSLVISLQLIDFLIPGLQNKYHNLPLTHTVPWLHGPRAGRHFHAPPCPCNAQETRREKLSHQRNTIFATCDGECWHKLQALGFDTWAIHFLICAFICKRTLGFCL